MASQEAITASKSSQDFGFQSTGLNDDYTQIHASCEPHMVDANMAGGDDDSSKSMDRSITVSGFCAADGTYISHTQKQTSEAAESDDGSQDGQQQTEEQTDDHILDAFGSTGNGGNEGTESGGKRKASNKADAAPAWSELKTKAGKERKRLPLACASCRRKKIRCSGEKPACKHCIRSRLPCVYKVTTRKAAPRTDYMAMLDKRLRRMEDRIIKILPKSEQEASASAVVRAVVKPALAGAIKQGAKKRKADEAFGADLSKWARSSSNPTNVNTSMALQLQEEEENKLLTEGREALPSQELQEHLAEVYFEVVYGQAYHLLHKPSYMRKLRAGTLPPVLILSVCAVSARFSNHSFFSNSVHFLRGEEWAAPAREIVKKRYDWPNITILTCYLILALHEFGTCQGGRSWMLGGDAIRMAFALQLHRDLEHDPHKPRSNVPLSFVDREIRRRTMWASFLMDRFTSSGIDRPMFVKEEDVKIQLPIKEKFFQLDMPGPTEDLHGRTPHPVPDDVGQLSNTQENMGVAAYMIRSIALWGRIISYLNQGGKDEDAHQMWEDASRYADLLNQAEELTRKLPPGLKYTVENLRLHNTEKMANQFLFLHISIQQNILFMSRFAVSSPTGRSQTDVPKEFVTKAGAKAFAAANRISELLKDAEKHLVSAPFVGYCAFLSGTVHIFGIFSGNAALEHAAKQHLATNIKFLSRMKRHWGMFHFMLENLREQYRTFMDTASRGVPAAQSTTSSPVFQYGDWFSRYPHGVSASDFVDPASFKQRESGDDGVLEQKPELHTVEEYITQLSPPQNQENMSPGSGSGSTKRKAGARLGSADDAEQRASQVPAGQVPQTGSQRPQQKQQAINQPSHRAKSLSGFPGANQVAMHRGSEGSVPLGFSGLSPVSPVDHNIFPHVTQQQQHLGHMFSQQDLFALSMSNRASAMLPQLDRQLVFHAYGGIGPGAMTDQDPGAMDWNILAAANGNGTEAGAQAGNPMQNTIPGSTTNDMLRNAHQQQQHQQHPSMVQNFIPDTSSAWFMPFNLDPANFAHDLAFVSAGGGGPGSFDSSFGGIFAQGDGSTQGHNDHLDL